MRAVSASARSGLVCDVGTGCVVRTPSIPSERRRSTPPCGGPCRKRALQRRRRGPAPSCVWAGTAAAAAGAASCAGAEGRSRCGDGSSRSGRGSGAGCTSTPGTGRANTKRQLLPSPRPPSSASQWGAGHRGGAARRGAARRTGPLARAEHGRGTAVQAQPGAAHVRLEHGFVPLTVGHAAQRGRLPAAVLEEAEPAVHGPRFGPRPRDELPAAAQRRVSSWAGRPRRVDAPARAACAPAPPRCRQGRSAASCTRRRGGGRGQWGRRGGCLTCVRLRTAAAGPRADHVTLVRSMPVRTPEPPPGARPRTM